MVPGVAHCPEYARGVRGCCCHWRSRTVVRQAVPCQEQPHTGETEMDVFEAIRTILAVRKFQDKPVPADLVHRVVEAARLTSSSRNGQPWQFIVIQDRETLKRIGELATSGPYTADAAFAVVVAYEKASQ